MKSPENKGLWGNHAFHPFLRPQTLVMTRTLVFSRGLSQND